MFLDKRVIMSASHTLTDHPEVKPVFRSEVVKAMETPRVTKPYFTKYEYAVLLASRQQQIAEGAKPLVSLDGLRTSDPQFLDQVVKREIEQRKLPYVFQRLMPNGNAEFWSAQELELSW
jgi:DNA-directed RNA polymerase I, II, and III subunit RPABC2